MAGWSGGVFTAPPVAFVDQLPLPRFYSAPGLELLTVAELLSS